MRTDDTARRIVNALVADGDADAKDVSQATGLSEPVVENRLIELEDAGVVGGTERVVDYDAVGFDVTAVLEITAEDGEHETVVDRLAAEPQLTTVYLVTGETDVVANGKFRDLTELNERVGELLTAPPVQDVTTTVVREVVRESEQFPLEFESD